MTATEEGYQQPKGTECHRCVHASEWCTRERVVRVHFSAWYWVSACYIDVVQFNFPTDTNISPQTILTAHAPSDVVLPTGTPIKPYASTYISCKRFFNESSVFFFNYIS